MRVYWQCTFCHAKVEYAVSAGRTIIKAVQECYRCGATTIGEFIVEKD